MMLTMHGQAERRLRGRGEERESSPADAIAEPDHRLARADESPLGRYQRRLDESDSSTPTAAIEDQVPAGPRKRSARTTSRTPRPIARTSKTPMIPSSRPERERGVTTASASFFGSAAAWPAAAVTVRSVVSVSSPIAWNVYVARRQVGRDRERDREHPVGVGRGLREGHDVVGPDEVDLAIAVRLEAGAGEDDRPPGGHLGGLDGDARGFPTGVGEDREGQREDERDGGRRGSQQPARHGGRPPCQRSPRGAGR